MVYLHFLSLSSLYYREYAKSIENRKIMRIILHKLTPSKLLKLHKKKALSSLQEVKKV